MVNAELELDFFFLDGVGVMSSVTTQGSEDGEQ